MTIPWLPRDAMLSYKMFKPKLPNFEQIETGRLSAYLKGSISSLALSVGELWLNLSEPFKWLTRAF